MNTTRFFKRHVSTLVATIALIAVTALPVSAQPPLPAEPLSDGDYDGSNTEFVPGEIQVKFSATADQFGVQGLLAAEGLQLAGAVESIAVLKLAVEPGQELEVIDALRNAPNVLYAEPNYIAYVLDTLPNDPGYASQWGLAKIGAPAAWDMTTGSSDVLIAVVDTGIDLDHPDFGCPGKLVTGPNFVSPGAPPDDDHGHGTHVAGIAAACANNSTGIAGVAWGARLMPVKVLDSRGSGTYNNVANGIIYAADHGARVINLSLGGASPSSTLSEAIAYAQDRGALVVAAAGNCGSGCWMGGQYYFNPLFYPASYPSTLAVAAIDWNDNWATFSEHHSYVDVAAPGIGIYSTLPGSGYGYLDGTSMATPYVSGLAALIWSLRPGLPPDQVRSIIQDTADDLATPAGQAGSGKDDYTGNGRINARLALGALISLDVSPAQASFLIDDDSGPFPSAIPIQVTTTSPEPITWTTTISPSVAWLGIVPHASGLVTAATSDSFFLTVPARPASYGTHTATVLVTGTTASGSIINGAATEVRISYVPKLHELRFPLMVNNQSY